MIVYPEKFQEIIIDRNNKKNNPQTLTVDEKIIPSCEHVTSLNLKLTVS